MAKGSVRKKGKKWYYRFYVEDESGNRVQKEFPGTESKSETESMLRKAMDDYESKMFVAKARNVTVGQLLDIWAEEELKPGPLSNGTVSMRIWRSAPSASWRSTASGSSPRRSVCGIRTSAARRTTASTPT